MKRVAVIQSNYIPWKGYFDIINSVDEFILYDCVQYTKNNWRNRNRIKTCHGSKWLTIPVEVQSHEQSIRDVRMADPAWATKHWRSIAQSYARAKSFDQYSDALEQLYRGMTEAHLSDINRRFIFGICEILNIRTRIRFSDEFQLRGTRQERLLDLLGQTGATEYLSGPSAKAYVDEDAFARMNISLVWMDYAAYPEYDQVHPPFDHNVSIVDLILNEGDSAHSFMKSFGHRIVGVGARAGGI